MMEASSKDFSYEIHTMGCKANLTDSQDLESQLLSMGGVESSVDPDVYILNTCTVTDQADKEAVKLLKKAKHKLVIATGCMAQVSPDVLSKTERENFVILRNSAKSEISEVISGWLKKQSQEGVVHGDRLGWHQSVRASNSYLQEGKTKRTRAFYKVQDGCNAFCSYCVIPLARGRSRSLSEQKILEGIQQLERDGVKEVVLTAIHAADYLDGNTDFIALAKSILKNTSTIRVRLTSLDPSEITKDLIFFMKENPRLCPHFHLSIQSANDKVLKDMGRNYSAKDIENTFEDIMTIIPHAYLGMDLIAGFPTEKKEDHLDTLERLKKLPFTKAHVFPYSVRRNTAAERLIQSGNIVAQHEIASRAKELRELGKKKMQIALESKIGSVQEILVEEKKIAVGSRTCSFGHARNFHKVVIPGDHPAGELKRIKVVGILKDDYLKGELF
ncbi:MAG: tRNA (N(6)-L-threonylcarbamoyladenosine(37)-C(2))-methylthiotransferase MtaB [Oligoflexia bacterium]|nr:tRNA (N(6)-L-threonylcarbamoyladenosine(37)-C(2))-methylthiotransferase MtaB [Oligoflexia bacterium]